MSDSVEWAAGLFEGEGCFTFRSAGNRPTFMAALSMSDKDVVDRFYRVVGIGSVSPRLKSPGWKSHWKDQWCWRANAGDAAIVAEMLLPYLGARRSERARSLIAERKFLVETSTAERTCPGCKIRFRPAFHTRSRYQIHCTMDCYDSDAASRRGRMAARV